MPLLLISYHRHPQALGDDEAVAGAIRALTGDHWHDEQGLGGLWFIRGHMFEDEVWSHLSEVVGPGDHLCVVDVSDRMIRGRLPHDLEQWLEERAS